MRYNAVLFDLDGTLLDTLEDLADSMNASLAAMNLPTHPADAYRYFVGDGVVNLALRAMPEQMRRDEAVVRKLVVEMRRQYRDRWNVKTKPYDGIGELLDALAVREMKSAVLSNKPDDFTQICVSKLLPNWRFAAVQGVNDEVPPKPDPKGALRIASALGVPPAEFVYLGDSNTDMKTAIAAGMHPVGALWGFRDADELIASGARTLIQRPAELLRLL
jgi:phosphoglycolate phosphatase